MHHSTANNQLMMRCFVMDTVKFSNVSSDRRHRWKSCFLITLETFVYILLRIKKLVALDQKINCLRSQLCRSVIKLFLRHLSQYRTQKWWNDEFKKQCERAKTSAVLLCNFKARKSLILLYLTPIFVRNHISRCITKKSATDCLWILTSTRQNLSWALSLITTTIDYFLTLQFAHDPSSWFF